MMTRRRQIALLYVSTAPLRWIRMSKAAADRATVSLLTNQWRPLRVTTKEQRKSFDP